MAGTPGTSRAFLAAALAVAGAGVLALLLRADPAGAAAGADERIAQLEADSTSRIATVDALARQVADLHRVVEELRHAVAGAARTAAVVSPPPEEPRPQPPPSGAASAAHPAAAIAWLQRLLPAKFAALTPAGLREMTELDLRGAKIEDADLAHLWALPNLTSLNLRGTAVSDAGLHDLAALPRLEVVELRGTAVTGPGLACLPITVRHVDLTDTPSGATGFHTLPPLPGLQTLKLNRLPVNDAGLEVLGRWPELRHLEIDGTQVSEHGLRRLLELNPRLARIEVRGVGVSPHLLAELGARYPQLQLVADGDANLPAIERVLRVR